MTTVLRLTPNQGYWAGSAWYNTPQPVAGAFSTTFTFELSNPSAGSLGPADGIAFVIQNSAAGTAALGPDGCGIGFGSGVCTGGTGITNSLAVEFKTYSDSGLLSENPLSSNANSVSIQSNGNYPNCVDYSCSIAINNSLPAGITMSDGTVHTVTINYSGPSTTLLDVILDGNDLFPNPVLGAPGGVTVNLNTLLSLTNGNAWVGFTAATGGGDDNQDILSWTFSPGAQSAVISTTSLAVLSFPNAAGTNVYDYTAQLTTPYANPVLSVQPILSTTAACNTLVQKNFWPARCFVYENAENSGLDVPVMFAVTCPASQNGTCGSAAEQNFFATLGTDFEFSFADNPFFVYPGVFSLLNPFPGWLKGVGNDPLNPCNAPVFTSNQISSFVIDSIHMTGGSGGTGSCWVATYDTPGELGPGLEAGPGITITSPKGSYPPNTVVNASYICSNPSSSKPLSSATGPYLTANSCKQSTGTQGPCTFTQIVGPNNLGGLSCTGTFTTPAKKGTYTFGVTAIDSGSNQNLGAAIYTVTSH
ncbi:MAG: L-type lectin-domain containing protein [Candidatus Binataceae bacterium]